MITCGVLVVTAVAGTVAEATGEATGWGRGAGYGSRMRIYLPDKHQHSLANPGTIRGDALGERETGRTVFCSTVSGNKEHGCSIATIPIKKDTKLN